MFALKRKWDLASRSGRQFAAITADVLRALISEFRICKQSLLQTGKQLPSFLWQPHFQGMALHLPLFKCSDCKFYRFAMQLEVYKLRHLLQYLSSFSGCHKVTTVAIWLVLHDLKQIA